jgi:hypothetical protein
VVANNFLSSFHASQEASPVWITMVGILSAIALTLLALIGAILAYRRISKRKRGAILSKTIDGHDSHLDFAFFFFLFSDFMIRSSLTSLQSQKILLAFQFLWSSLI